MNQLNDKPVTIERQGRAMSGLPILALNLATCVTIPFILTDGIRMAEWATVTGGGVVLVAMFLIWRGFFTLEPNEACVLVAWGEYCGTIRDGGFHWTSPFARKRAVSLRAQTLLVDRLKLNDKHGAALELAAVIVWRVVDTARATFDVHDVENYVRDQCLSSARHLVSNSSEPIEEKSLRRGVGQLQESLRGQLQERVARAGVIIDEVRITHRCDTWMPTDAASASAA